MKKELLMTAALLLCAATAQSAERTEDEMKAAAMQVLQGGTAGTRRRAASTAELEELKVLPMLRIYGYTDGGFAVVSADDRFDAVVGYSTTQFTDTMPCGFRWWLEASNAAMEQEAASPTTAARARRAARAVRSKIVPMVTTEWGQKKPYYNYCKYEIGGKQYQFVTGCVATAMAQVMKYHEYPARGKGSHSYNVTYNNVGTVKFSADFSNSVYDWDAMFDTYGSTYTDLGLTDSHTAAVAQLMSDCGIAVDMSYNGNSSGASANKIAPALKDYFSYDSQTQYYDRENYSDTEWMDLIYNELASHRPVIYSGHESMALNAAGHSFVIHGMDETGKVYINWGWEGYCDGYYNIDNLRPTSTNYNYGQAMIAVVPGSGATQQKMSMEIQVSSGGSVGCGDKTVNNGSAVVAFDRGSTVTLTVSPNSGFKLKSLVVGGVDVTNRVTNGKYTISSLTSDTTVSATFEVVNEFALTLDASGNGQIEYDGTTVRDGQQTYIVARKSNVNLTFKADEGYYISSLTLNGVNDIKDIVYLPTLNPYKSLTRTISSVSKDNTYKVVFAELPKKEYSLHFSTSEGGTVIYNGNTMYDDWKEFKVTEGSDAVITVNPDNGYRVRYINVNGNDVTSQLSNGQLTIRNITESTNVTVLFIKKTHKLEILKSDRGYVRYDDRDMIDRDWYWTVDDGTEITMTVHPDKYYRLTEFLVNGVNVISQIAGNTFKAIVTADMTVSAKFDLVISALKDEELVFIQWNEQELVYTGEPQKLSWKNRLAYSGLEVTSDGLTNYVDAGTYSDEIEMTLKYGADTRTVKVPCNYTIKPAKLTATVQNVQRAYGAENPQFTAKYTGFVNGETEAVLTNKGTFATAANKESPAGEYAITLTGVEAMNYEVTTIAGKLTIGICKLTVKVDNAVRVYGEDNPKFTYTVTGLVNGDRQEDVITVAGTFTTTATRTSGVGEYAVKCTGVKAKNYEVETIDGVLTVTPASLIAKVNDATRPYGEDNPQFTAKYTGFVNGDTESALTNKGRFETSATKASDVGRYDVTLTGVEAKNYILYKVEPGTLTVERAEQQVVWNQELTLLDQYSQLELTATATSGLAVSYQVAQGSDACSLVKIGNANFLDCFGTGDVTLSAWQEGDKNYYPTLRTYKQVKVVPTGIGDVEAGGYTVTAKRGQLLIGGLRDGDTVQVTDLAGRTVYSGGQSVVYVARGSYVVRIGQWKRKVLVK